MKKNKKTFGDQKNKTNGRQNIKILEMTATVCIYLKFSETIVKMSAASFRKDWFWRLWKTKYLRIKMKIIENIRIVGRRKIWELSAAKNYDNWWYHWNATFYNSIFNCQSSWGRFVCLIVWLSVRLPVCLSVCIFVFLSVCLSLRLSISASLYIPLSLSLYLSISLSVFLSPTLFSRPANFHDFWRPLINSNFRGRQSLIFLFLSAAIFVNFRRSTVFFTFGGAYCQKFINWRRQFHKR